jgi:carbon storage regulator CsrA
MLVLSRKAGQKIHIGDEIVVEIRRIAGNRVTIALEAPRHLRILRGELQEAAQEFEVEIEDLVEAPELTHAAYVPAGLDLQLTGSAHATH